MMEFIAQLFPGAASMANIHPLAVHFPIALLTSFVALESLALFSRSGESLRLAASWLLYLGTLGACVAVAAGLWAAATVPHPEEVHAIMEKHEKFGFAVLSLSIVLSVWRLTNAARFSRLGQVLHWLLAVIMVVTMALGADLGGLMVYRYGVATQTMDATPRDHDHPDGDEQRERETDATDVFRGKLNRLYFRY